LKLLPLDNESEHYIQASLDKLFKDPKTIIVAYRLSSICNADEIIVFNNNSMQEQGIIKSCTKKVLYAKYYNMQFKGIDEMIDERDIKDSLVISKR